MTAAHPDLLAFFKALADPNRLRIVGLLAHAPHTVEQLAAALADGADPGAFDRKVLATFIGPDGRFTAFPSQAKKSLVLIRHALQAFEPGGRFTEKQVDERLRRCSDDTARIRRAFVDHGFMRRTPDGSAYWRVDEAP